MTEPIRLLHLSDIHFRTGTTWESRPVLRSLASFIGREVKTGLIPDLVVVTGDLAFSGKPQEYALAQKWLEGELWPVLSQDPASPLPKERLLLVPGNHDVDRDAVDLVAEAVQSSLLSGKDQRKIAALLSHKSQRKALLKRHAAYLKFYKDWLGIKAPPLPWWQRTFNIGGQSLHVAGLDSAWMACGDQDRGRLLLSRYQVSQTALAEEAEGAQWRLALLHHPWDYLAEFEAQEMRQQIHLHRDLVLRGHLHEGETTLVRSPDPARSCLELTAGCVYETSRYHNAFQWIELHALSDEAPKRVRVLFRAWVKVAWQVDGNQPGCPKGTAEFRYDSSADGPNGPPPPKAPTVPPEYHAWLRRTYGGYDLLGQDTHQGRAVTLGDVYVPAVTTSGPATFGPGQTEEGITLLLSRLDHGSLYCSALAGGGKSTFCKWAVLQSIPGAPLPTGVPAPDEFVEPLPPPGLIGRLPLLVPLRELAATMDCPRGAITWGRRELERALANWVDRAVPDGLSGRLVIDHLGHGSAFLLFDGLDEVPSSLDPPGGRVYPRALLLTGLAAALPGWSKAGNRILLTSRPYGLNEADLDSLGLPHAPLKPVPKPLQQLFVRRWFDTFGHAELAQGLIDNIHQRDDLAPLAENPLLLRALCVLHGNNEHLPEDRYPLYGRIVDSVLIARYPDNVERLPVRARLEEIAWGMHTGEPWGTPRQAPSTEVTDRELEVLLRDFLQLDPVRESGRVKPAAVRQDLVARSGLLIPLAGGRATFYHLSFQEYLAAERIAHVTVDRSELRLLFLDHWGEPGWGPTLLFLFAGQVFTYSRADIALRMLADLAGILVAGGGELDPTAAVLVGDAMDLCLAKGWSLPEELRERFRRVCLRSIDEEIELPARQRLGLLLGLLGDPRTDDLRNPAAYAEVPGGVYLFGEDRESNLIETPFLIARFPVTNGQYRSFMDAGGYSDRRWWSPQGWNWRNKLGVSEPLYWQDRRWNGPNQPVVGVSYWEAEACCAWAGGRLPREREWEAAARGPDGCDYPWCGPWVDRICNSDEARLGTTSPVGIFPRSRQNRCLIDDLAGNCWEWCQDIDGDSEVSPSCALRGGAFYDMVEQMRACVRNCDPPETRSWGIGFRCLRTDRR